MFSNGKVISEEMMKQKMNLFRTENPTAIRAVASGSKAIYDLLNQTKLIVLDLAFAA